MLNLTPSAALAASVSGLVVAGSVLSPATNKVALVKAAFTPSPTLDPATLTLADFTGSGAIVFASSLAYVDPVAGFQEVRLNPPVGGFKWSPTNATNLPQQIFGFVVTDTTGATLVGAGLLDEPVTLTAAGQIIDLETLRFRMPVNVMGP